MITNWLEIEKEAKLILRDPVESVLGCEWDESIPLFCIYSLSEIPLLASCAFLICETESTVVVSEIRWEYEENTDQQFEEPVLNKPSFKIRKGELEQKVNGWIHFLEHLDLSVQPSKSTVGIDGERNGLLTYFLAENYREEWMNEGPPERDILNNWYREVVSECIKSISQDPQAT